ncbi:hypothetical protein GF319_15675 [Candidatus Bathyarchaeota archaeon]|nr:hypothetical protein [Candidatus Bathyarchaeota archaeon]
MFWDEEIKPEDIEEIIEWTARELYKYGLETAAILFIESYKPISRVGSSMGQVFFYPLLPFLGDNAMVKGDKFFRIFQEKENVDKLIDRLEEISIKGIEPKVNDQRKVSTNEISHGKKEKKGWRKYLPF